MNGIRRPFVQKGMWHFVLILILSGMILALIRSFFFMQVEVPSDRYDLGLLAGDRVVVNRTSYGLRISNTPWWKYHRWGKCEMSIGDLVAYDYPDGSGRISIDRVMGLPGDTLWIEESPDEFTVVPDGAFGIGSVIVPEPQVMGRPTCVTYSVDRTQPFYKLLRPKRLFVKIR